MTEEKKPIKTQSKNPDKLGLRAIAIFVLAFVGGWLLIWMLTKGTVEELSVKNIEPEEIRPGLRINNSWTEWPDVGTTQDTALRYTRQENGGGSIVGRYSDGPLVQHTGVMSEHCLKDSTDGWQEYKLDEIEGYLPVEGSTACDEFSAAAYGEYEGEEAVFVSESSLVHTFVTEFNDEWVVLTRSVTNTLQENDQVAADDFKREVRLAVSDLVNEVLPSTEEDSSE